MNRGLTDRFVQSIIVDPRNSGTLYAGTLYQGIFKSTDQGANWKPVNYGLGDLCVTVFSVLDRSNRMPFDDANTAMACGCDRIHS